MSPLLEVNQRSQDSFTSSDLVSISLMIWVLCSEYSQYPSKIVKIKMEYNSKMGIIKDHTDSLCTRICSTIQFI